MLIRGSRKYNFRHNRERMQPLPFGQMINGQGLGLVSKYRYGICPMSFNGCEVIAVHNALVYLGKPQKLADIAFYMEKFRVLMGFFGCNVYRTGKALSHFGAEFDYSRNIGDSDIFILSYWTGRRFLSSIHTVFCIKTDEGYNVYNRFNNCPTVRFYRTADELTKSKRPIAVYSIKKEN